MSDYYLLITDAGKALETAAHASGGTVNLTDFAVGDGGGSAVTPDAAQTALVNEVYRDAISSLTVDASDDSVLDAECVIPASSGGYTIREIGIFADDGTLYATGSFAEQDKPAPDSGYAASLQIFAELAVSDTSDIALTVTDGSYLTESQGNTLYLRQDKNLSEIADQGEDAQAEARNNLALGELATKDSLIAEDVGALPITGGKVTGNVDIVGDGTREPLSIKGTSPSWVGASVTNLNTSGGSYFNFNLGDNETPVSGINSYYVNGSICLELTASTAFVDGQNNRKSMFRLNPDMGTVGSMDGWPLCDNGERVYSSLNPPPPPEAGWNQNIGAHLFAQIGPGDASPGSLWSGSAIAPMSMYYSSSTRAAFHAGAYGNWAGTWMMLGQCSSADSASASGTMFVRIA